MAQNQFTIDNQTNEGKIALLKIGLAKNFHFEVDSLRIHRLIELKDQPWDLTLTHENAVFSNYSFAENSDEQGIFEDFSFTVKILKALCPTNWEKFWSKFRSKNLVISLKNFNTYTRTFGPVRASYSHATPDDFFQGEYYIINFKPSRHFEIDQPGEVIDSAIVECQN